MSADAEVEFLQGLLEEYKLKVPEWRSYCVGLYRSNEERSVVLQHHLGWYHYTGEQDEFESERVKQCTKHIQHFIARVREKGFLVSQRKRHSSLGRGGWYDFWKISLQKDIEFKLLHKDALSDGMSKYLKSA